MFIKHASCHHIQFSFTKTFLFFLIFIVLIIIILGVPLLCIFLILKPQTPEFSLQTVNVESYKLDTTSQNLVVSSVLSLSLRAENPNKIGLSYDSSRFHVLSQGLVVGLIRIPQFHQPPLSKNVSIQTRVSFERVNVSEIVMQKNVRIDDSSNGDADIRVLGDIRAQVRVFNIILPKIKVALDCDLFVSKSHFALSNEAYSTTRIHDHKISVPLNSQTVSKKCSLAVLI